MLTIITVSNQYPSYSETFVSTEMTALEAQGARVYSYSLRQGQAGLTAATPYIRRPGRWRLVPWLLPAIPNALMARRAGRFPSWGAGIARDVYVTAHALRLRRAVRRLKATDVIMHAHFLARPSQVALAPLSRGTLGRVVATVHASDVRNLSTMRRVGQAPDAIRFASRYVMARAEMADALPERSAVIPCAVFDARRDQPAEPPQVGRVRLVTVARLVPSKGFDKMILAVETAVKMGVYVDWHVVGDGVCRDQIEGLARRDDLAAFLTVRLEGAQPHDSALDAIRDADVMLLLSQDPTRLAGGGDGLPVAILEALLLEKPVIATNVAGIPEAVVHGVTGFLVPADDPVRAAAESIVRLARDPGLAQEMGRHGRQFCLARFESGRVAQQLIAFLRGEGDASN